MRRHRPMTQEERAKQQMLWNDRLLGWSLVVVSLCIVGMLIFGGR